MAIIKVGNFDDIGVKPKRGKGALSLPKAMSLSATRQLRSDIDVRGLNMVRSKDPWALYLKRITLHKGFEGFLSGIFNKTNEVYFVTLAWDYSGRRPKVWPYTTLDPSEYVLKMKKGQTRQFLGDGVAMWPARRVSGALNVIIMVYESDQDMVRAGEVTESIHSAVDKSTLTDLVSVIAANPAAATARAIAGAVKDTLQSIGKIMKKNKNDAVELFEGSYGTHLVQRSRVERYDTDAAGVGVGFDVVDRTATTGQSGH